MDKSEAIIVESNGTGMEQALSCAENFVQDIPAKEALRVRLLAEEMMCLVREISGGMEAEFWIEKSEDAVYLHLMTDMLMYGEKRRKLLAISTSGKNAAAKGVLGKIRDVFEWALLPEDERIAIETKMGVGTGSPTAYKAAVFSSWSMRSYAATMKERDDDFAKEALDELEKSIIVNLAKDVSIAIKGDNVEMVVEKKIS